jgi:hypothetical protein
MSIIGGSGSGGSGGDAGTGGAGGGKLFVDDDWKSQAAAEKERLAEEAAKREAEARAAGGDEAGDGDLPPAEFGALVADLRFAALASMGLIRDPSTGRPTPADPRQARYHIDMLGVLEAKTRGNLDPEEAEFLKAALDELRMIWVRLTGGLAPFVTVPPNPSEG